MIHRVVLSNGRVLLIEERDNEISLADEQEGFKGEADMYICSILPGGVMVMPNSGTATDYLTEGLKRTAELDYVEDEQPELHEDRIKQAVAEETETDPDDWEYFDGPETGVGVEFWLRNIISDTQVYVCDDQGMITVSIQNEE